MTETLRAQFFFFCRVIDTLSELYLKVMFKYRAYEKNDLESTYKKSSIFVANSLTHYKNPMVKFLFFTILGPCMHSSL